MSHKTVKNPHECPTCEKSPCACPATGGADASSTDKDKIKTGESNKANTTINEPSLVVTPEQVQTTPEVITSDRTSLLTSPPSFFGDMQNNSGNNNEPNANAQNDGEASQSAPSSGPSQ